MRVGLWNAEATGSFGDVSWRAFAHAVYAEADVLVIELTQNTTTPAQAAAAAAVAWRFVPASFNRPWAQRVRACTSASVRVRCARSALCLAVHAPPPPPQVGVRVLSIV